MKFDKMKEWMKKNNAKKKGMAALSAVLVLSLAIGGTLAYLSMKTNEKENEFSFANMGEDEDLSIILIEPDWDGDTTGNNQKDREDIDDEDLGKTMAEEVQPGDYIPKNPYIVNTSEAGTVDAKVWAAMKMTFAKGTGEELTETELNWLLERMDFYFENDKGRNEEANPSENDAVWTRLGNDDNKDHAYQNVYFYYNTALDRGEVSKPLFEYLYFDLAQMDNSAAETLKDEWCGLQINLVGYAIQEKNIAYDVMPNFFEDYLLNGKSGADLVTFDPVTGTYN